jgi:hypothetical protein
MVCVTSAKYVMYADLYAPTESVDEFTGAIVKTWELVSTIPCLARAIVTTSTGSNSSNFVTGKYINYPENTIKLRSKTPIDSSYRVVSIRNTEQVIWKEDQYGANNGGLNGATIFEPRGSTPITDHRGMVLEYETMLERQEIQQLTLEA